MSGIIELSVANTCSEFNHAALMQTSALNLTRVCFALATSPGSRSFRCDILTFAKRYSFFIVTRVTYFGVVYLDCCVELDMDVCKVSLEVI